jgi:ABC-type lipoprotein export system ATPase subunit
MSILQEIHTWSKTLPDWQQDAIRRLYVNRHLSASDLDDLYALAKTAQGIEDPEKRVPTKLVDADIAVPPVPSRLVQIAAIKDLVNVNALAEGQSLSLSPTGLTVIYGENGAGKSGYSRVLKKACRARDQAEPILPDARKPPESVAEPTAAFEVLVNGADTPMIWQGGHASPEELSEIAVFDAHCARAYVDNQGDFAYMPYGLDILEGLVKTCNSLRALAAKDLDVNKPNVEPLAVLSKTQTKVGAMLNGLSATTKIADLEALSSLTDAELSRLATLNKTLAEADPKQKAQILRLRSTRFTGLANRIASAAALVSDEKIRSLQELVQKSNAAKQTAELASKEFKEKPGQLLGTGSDPWKELFEAARVFAAESHAGHDFPNLPPESQCPLCQELLGKDGAARLVAFDAFVQQSAETAAKAAKAIAVAAYRAIENAPLDLAIDDALRAEIIETFAENPEACADFQKALLDRRAAAMKSAGGAAAWEAIPPLTVDPSADLEAKAARLLIEAKALEDTMDVKAKAAMVAEQAEFESRRKLADIKATVLEAIGKFALCEKLKLCVNAATTTSISRKSTDLSKEMATQEVLEALNAELRALNVHELQVVMKPVSPGGKTHYKLALQLPGGGAPSAILSEGEQRAIAIAAFLAEVKLGKGLGGIVFDDPVSSLDHRRRSHVASRLVQEAKARQVVLFTHDIYFLCIIQQEAELAGTPATTQCIGRGPTGFGVKTDRLPFDTLSTTKRVKALRVLCDKVAQAHKSGDEAETTRLTREAYSHLRMAWERGVEEVLLAGAVTRFTEGVSTQRLRYVTVEDSDYEAINIGMTKSSKFSGHDPAMSAHLSNPHPDDLREDIGKLESWRASVEARKLHVSHRRDK